jgi:hypothetical protein
MIYLEFEENWHWFKEKKFLSFLYIPIEIDKNLGKIDKLLRV